MTRFSSQIVYCSPERILRRSVVEIDNQNRINSIFSLDDNLTESSHTIFMNGILSSEIFSLKQNISIDKLEECKQNYNYFDLTSENPMIQNNADKPLILDFGTENIDVINTLLQRNAAFLNAFTIFEIIAGCVYYPAVLSGIQNKMTENQRTHILLWENTNLVEKKLTKNSSVKLLI